MNSIGGSNFFQTRASWEMYDPILNQAFDIEKKHGTVGYCRCCNPTVQINSTVWFCTGVCAGIQNFKFLVSGSGRPPMLWASIGLYVRTDFFFRPRLALVWCVQRHTPTHGETGSGSKDGFIRREFCEFINEGI